MSMMQTVIVYNGSSWSTSPAWIFEYNDRAPGDPSSVNYLSLTKVTFPTGGTITYTYTTLNPITSPGAVGYTRAVATKTVNANDGTGNHTWNYSYSFSGYVGTNTVTDPLGNATVYIETSLGTSHVSYYPTQVNYYTGSHSSGTLLKYVKTSYSYAAPTTDNACRTDTSVVPVSVTTIWANNQQAETITGYDSGFSFTDGSGVNFSAIYGLPTTKQDYDYGSSAPGSLLKATTTNYLALSNPTYLNENMLALPSSVQITNGGGTQTAYTKYAYDGTGVVSSGVSTQHVSSPYGTARGNQTSMQRWLNTNTVSTQNCSTTIGTGGYAVTNATIFDTGVANVTTDPCGHTTTKLYSSTYAGAYPTTVTNALGQSTTYGYDFDTGRMTSSKDPNSLTTSYAYDDIWRLSNVTYPNGGSDVITREETSFPFSTTLTKKINSTENYVATSTFDGLGRVFMTQVASDPQGTIETDTAYDAKGRVFTVSNPHRAAGDPTSSPGTTTYSYDGLNRKTSVAYPDGSVLTTAYCGSSTLVTDPTKRWRRSRVDGLQRMVEVDEPNAIGASAAATGCPRPGDPIWVTSYTYDALGDLTQAVQDGTQTRAFSYDSLSNLLTSHNPETNPGTNNTIYAYDADGNVATRTDARLITTTYGYDKIHRELSRVYTNNDPSLSFTYDQGSCLGLLNCANIGHRTGMTDAAGSEAWSYDIIDRMRQDQRTAASSPNNISKTMTDSLDYAGNVISIAYPTGRTVNYKYDAANRPSTATDGSNGVTYATDAQVAPSGCLANAVCYTPQGSVYALSIGQSSSFTGLNLTTIYNTRLQPTNIMASSAAGSATDISYSFVDPSSNGNSGRVFSITNNLNSSRSQSFTYDQVNRILSAGTSATTGPYCWGYQFSYDSFGNLLSQSAWTPNYGSCSESILALELTDGYNHLTNFSYDASGNTLNDGVNAYTWNGESELSMGGGVNYLYDGEAQRVSKVGSKLYWYGPNGEILAETDSSGSTLNEYVYFGGRRVADLPSGGGALYYSEDFLGSSRVITQSNGTICYDADFYPYGGERAYTDTCSQNYKFQGKERDAETQNDNFGARYYSWRFGRWLSSDWSADPAPIPYANLENPQTLNLYGLVSDDPESFADLTGHQGDEDADSETVADPRGEAELKAAGESVEAEAARNQEASLNAFTGTAHDDPLTGICYVGSTAQNTSMSSSKPGTLGNLDHQQTAQEEADKMGGDREVSVATPGGEKNSRRIDAAKTENGVVVEAVQVIRPNKNGTPPAREARAAKDIENATGVKPRLVPVRPLPTNPQPAVQPNPPAPVQQITPPKGQ
jgi:RHS repeat-associated protein